LALGSRARQLGESCRGTRERRAASGATETEDVDTAVGDRPQLKPDETPRRSSRPQLEAGRGEDRQKLGGGVPEARLVRLRDLDVDPRRPPERVAGAPKDRNLESFDVDLPPGPIRLLKIETRF